MGGIFSGNSEGSKKPHDDGRLLPKHVGASNKISGTDQCVLLVISATIFTHFYDAIQHHVYFSNDCSRHKHERNVTVPSLHTSPDPLNKMLNVS
jgi:hypothetical protein